MNIPFYPYVDLRLREFSRGPQIASYSLPRSKLLKPLQHEDMVETGLEAKDTKTAGPRVVFLGDAAYDI